MKKLLKIFVSVVLSVGATLGHGQNETKTWYFGDHAGLNFSTIPPTILTNGALGYSHQEGCACISDQSGNILFYTDGMTIWDKTHSPMANGSGLLGNNSTTQSSLILKKYNSSTLYYVFTLDLQGGANGLCYSIVDISLASGNGSVTTKNVQLFTPSEEKLTCVQHANGTDVWILTHDYNSQNFRAHLLTASGINTTAVVSTVGTVHDGQILTTIGQMKASPDGKKVALVIGGMKTVELLDFNNTTGMFSNALTLVDTLNGPYGCEFSPDSKKLYSSALVYPVLLQWDLCKPTQAAILQSQLAIATITTTPFAMQLASDGKIYMAHLQQSFLSTISAPNQLGTACNYSEVAQSVSTGTSSQGLPNFPPYFFRSQASLSITAVPHFSICSGETLTLSTSGASSYTWNSTLVGASIPISPTITSTYSVIATASTGCLEGTVTVTVNACTGISEIEYNTHFRVYPNPVVNDQLTLELAETSKATAYLYNAQGKPVYTLELLPGKQTFNFTSLSSGLYYLRIINDTTTNTYRILKE